MLQQYLLGIEIEVLNTMKSKKLPSLHARGYKEEGTTTTPFGIMVLNDLDRFHFVGDAMI